MTELTLFTTAGCHLCELAKDILKPIALSHHLSINEVEIGDDDTLVEKYGIRIPVVQFANNAELNWPFEAQDILKAIDAA